MGCVVGVTMKLLGAPRIVRADFKFRIALRIELAKAGNGEDVVLRAKLRAQCVGCVCATSSALQPSTCVVVHYGLRLFKQRMIQRNTIQGVPACNYSVPCRYPS